VVFAVADGYGLSMPVFDRNRPFVQSDITLKLARDDAPIAGRITDLQGKPIAGVSVTVHQLWWPTEGDLAGLLAALKKKDGLMEATLAQRFMQTGVWMGRAVGRILPPAVSDAEGRVQIKGVGRERVVMLRIEGPTIVSKEFWGMTRAGDALKVTSTQPGGE